MISKCCKRTRIGTNSCHNMYFCPLCQCSNFYKGIAFLLLYGRDLRITSESALNWPSTPYMVDLEDYMSEVTSNLSEAWEIARVPTQEAQAHEKYQYSKQQESLGEKSMVYNMPQSVSGKACKTFLWTLLCALPRDVSRIWRRGCNTVCAPIILYT